MSAYAAMGRQFVYAFFREELKMERAQLETLEKTVHRRNEADWYPRFDREVSEG